MVTFCPSARADFKWSHQNLKNSVVARENKTCGVGGREIQAVKTCGVPCTSLGIKSSQNILSDYVPEALCLFCVKMQSAKLLF